MLYFSVSLSFVNLLTVSSMRSTSLAHKTPMGMSKKFSKHLKRTEKKMHTKSSKMHIDRQIKEKRFKTSS